MKAYINAGTEALLEPESTNGPWARTGNAILFYIFALCVSVVVTTFLARVFGPHYSELQGPDDLDWDTFVLHLRSALDLAGMVFVSVCFIFILLFS